MKTVITLLRFFLILSCSLQISCSIDPPVQNGDNDQKEPEEDFTVPHRTPVQIRSRALWASINGRSDATFPAAHFEDYNNKVLVSWRMWDIDPEDMAFDIYRKTGNGSRKKLNSSPITDATCWQDTKADLSQDNTYYLHIADGEKAVASFTLTAQRGKNGLPYVSVPMASTTELGWEYDGNDAAVGDLDGDGQYEIVIKRIVDTGSGETEGEEADDAYITPSSLRHTTLFEAYRLNGEFMWRICSGPNIILGNSACFAVCDFDGDGKAEVALRTSEGTVFGDGKEIKDTNVDGKTDYRSSTNRYITDSRCPEFISVVNGRTGAEIDRAPFIPLGTPMEWGDDRGHRASSYRIGAGNLSGGCPSIIIGRGCYEKIVVRAYDLYEGRLHLRWNFDTTANYGEYADYSAQGYHFFRCADVDNDGMDEVVYGSCTIDHDGKGLNCCGLGHGDALHIGAFNPAEPEKQYIWACYETGSVGAALRDAATGNVIWKFDSTDDVGRAMTADIDPDSYGNEMWWAGGNARSLDGSRDLGYKPTSCNFAIWWTGSLNRQLLNGTVIDEYDKAMMAKPWNRDNPWKRPFTLNRYDVVSINSSKENPCYSGDFLGDWREEVILMKSDGSEMRIFSTWYPTQYRFPFLMSDPAYNMCAVNQQMGYNQPNQLSYYLGPELLKSPGPRKPACSKP